MNAQEKSDKVRKINAAEFNVKNLSRYDDDGNRIRFSPKDMGMKKNSSARQKAVRMVRYEEEVVADGEVIESFKGEHKSKDGDVYFKEWAMDEVREAYKYVNQDAVVVVNPRWGRFLELNEDEKAFLKANGRGRMDKLNMNSDARDMEILRGE